jgi:hypothetical protein
MSPPVGGRGGAALDLVEAESMAAPLQAPPVISVRTEARLARQRIFDREDPPTFWAVIDEAALRKRVGGCDVMRDQLHHLCRMAERPNIGIQVIPDVVGAHTSMTGSFTILDYKASEDPSLIYVELGAAGDLFLEKPEDVAHYRKSVSNR